jgi:fimbrial chaperone protein
MIPNIHARAAALLAAATLAGAAQASGLRVSPLRVDLSAQQNSSQIELTNFGSAPVPVQVSVSGWSQAEGRDSYAPSKDIFFAPPIVTVPAGGKTIVRFRLRGAAPRDAERAYRAFFQEMAPPQQANQGGMSFRLKFGVPIFVAPGTGAAPRLELRHGVASGVLKLMLANSGSAHLKIHGIEVYPASVDRQKPTQRPLASASLSDTGTNYLLPGSRLAWTLKLPAGTDPTRSAVLVRTDDYSGKAAAGMTQSGWLWQSLDAVAAPAKTDGGH